VGGVEVFLECAVHKRGLLLNHSDVGSEIFEPIVRNFLSIYLNVSLLSLNDPG
jgi:hypothetical protein